MNRGLDFPHGCTILARKTSEYWRKGEAISGIAKGDPRAPPGIGNAFAAVLDPSRRALLAALADVAPRRADVLARLAGMSSTLAGKHLILLRKAGLLEAVAPPDGDGRKSFYRFPAHRVARDAAGSLVLDFGCVVLRLPGW